MEETEEGPFIRRRSMNCEGYYKDHHLPDVTAQTDIASGAITVFKGQFPESAN